MDDPCVVCSKIFAGLRFKNQKLCSECLDNEDLFVTRKKAISIYYLPYDCLDDLVRYRISSRNQLAYLKSDIEELADSVVPNWRFRFDQREQKNKLIAEHRKERDEFIESIQDTFSNIYCYISDVIDHFNSDGRIRNIKLEDKSYRINYTVIENSAQTVNLKNKIIKFRNDKEVFLKFCHDLNDRMAKISKIKHYKYAKSYFQYEIDLYLFDFPYPTKRELKKMIKESYSRVKIIDELDKKYPKWPHYYDTVFIIQFVKTGNLIQTINLHNSNDSDDSEYQITIEYDCIETYCKGIHLRYERMMKRRNNKGINYDCILYIQYGLDILNEIRFGSDVNEYFKSSKDVIKYREDEKKSDF